LFTVVVHDDKDIIHCISSYDCNVTRIGAGGVITHIYEWKNKTRYAYDLEKEEESPGAPAESRAAVVSRSSILFIALRGCRLVPVAYYSYILLALFR
jgi:hypothetical protein